jgi:hypothetical protein
VRRPFVVGASGSLDGRPSWVPAGIGTMSNTTFVFGMDSVWRGRGAWRRTTSQADDECCCETRRELQRGAG